MIVWGRSEGSRWPRWPRPQTSSPPSQSWESDDPEPAKAKVLSARPGNFAELACEPSAHLKQGASKGNSLCLFSSLSRGGFGLLCPARGTERAATPPGRWDSGFHVCSLEGVAASGSTSAPCAVVEGWGVPQVEGHFEAQEHRGQGGQGQELQEELQQLVVDGAFVPHLPHPKTRGWGEVDTRPPKFTLRGRWRQPRLSGSPTGWWP